MKVVALLPMKGMSERVPNKNLKLFNGKPLYHIVLNTLLNSKYIDTIVVNTDSDVLKNDILINFKERVVVVDRKKEVCGNYVSMNKVLEQDINTVESDIYIQTHSTNPLLKTETIDCALEKMIGILTSTSKTDSIFSVTKVQKRFYTKESKPMNHDTKILVTQHLEPIFEENSCFYIFTKQGFMENNSRIGRRPYMYQIDKIESTDIDEPQDFIIAEALHSLLR
ncbi:acylneuraminate cytidylyltransferase family protein [Polaribacter sp.]|jgi:CMP-N-acetylneuraminic acid synthetase|uniref:acylneuraminate cytidylyltransferase family protein n=1 Tax=Polaribacter sp. TaxID=1920175 RepID=UPI0040483642